MRIREIYSIIKRYSEQIGQLRFEPIKNSTDLTVINWVKAYNSFELLETTNIFTRELTKFRKKLSNIYINRSESFVIDTSTHAQIKGYLQEINVKINILNDLFSVTHEIQDNNTASFKLYDFKSFSEYVAFCNELNTKILNPLNRIKEECLLGELESGSKWLSIVFKTSLGVSLFFGIVRISFDCLIHDYQTYRVTKNLIETLELSKDAIDEFNKKMEEQSTANITAKTDTLINSVNTAHPSVFNNLDSGEKAEFQNSLVISVNLLMKHIDKGLEVYEALDKPTNERYELPDYNQLMIVKTEQKKIEK